jgi:hypothetical protein
MAERVLVVIVVTRLLDVMTDQEAGLAEIAVCEWIIIIIEMMFAEENPKFSQECLVIWER